MMIVSVVAIIVVFCFVSFIVFLSVKSKRRELEIKAELYAKALELGRELPDDFLKEKEQISKSLKTGILLIAIGVAISTFMAVMEPDDGFRGAIGGVIPIALGIAFLIIFFVSKKQGVGDGED